MELCIRVTNKSKLDVVMRQRENGTGKEKKVGCNRNKNGSTPFLRTTNTQQRLLRDNKLLRVVTHTDRPAG